MQQDDQAIVLDDDSSSSEGEDYVRSSECMPNR
jgi:hypothetical protein